MSAWISFGRCGFGGNLGLFPELRLGIVRVGCCRGAIVDHLRALRIQAEETLKGIIRGRGK